MAAIAGCSETSCAITRVGAEKPKKGASRRWVAALWRGCGWLECGFSKLHATVPGYGKCCLISRCVASPSVRGRLHRTTVSKEPSPQLRYSRCLRRVFVVSCMYHGDSNAVHHSFHQHFSSQHNLPISVTTTLQIP